VVALATVAELRNFAQIPELPEAASTLALDGISALVRAYTGRTFSATVDEVVRLDGSGSRSLLLPGLPVLEVASIVEAPGSSSEATLVDGVGFEWSADGIVRRIDGGIFAGRLRHYAVTYSHGLEAPEDPETEAEVPADVKLVVLRIAARAVINPEGLTQENVPGGGATFGFDATRLGVLAEPDKDALSPYRVTV
jgi:hypothetical protein